MNKTLFERYEFKEFIVRAIHELGFYKPTEIQERLIPAIINGESAIGQSQTGTGKTHAYLFPILNKIDHTREEVQAVITAPTRELAQQIYDEVTKILKHCSNDEKINVKNLIGGTDKQRTIEKLKKQPHIVIGTPGRINDLVKAEALNVYPATSLVVDEADLMLDMGFIDDVDQIASRMADKLQILVFSATIPEKLKPFLKKYMENPRFTHVDPNQAAAPKIDHILIPVRHREKNTILKAVLEIINPYLAIIFTNTKRTADEVYEYLVQSQLNTGRLHGDLSPRERKKVMKQIKNLEFQFVVATDLAARGIDIEGVSHVINYELPEDLDFYIHRVGRTARAEYSGIAFTLYNIEDEGAIQSLEKKGIVFSHQDIKNNQFVDIGPRNKRQNRKKEVDEIVSNVRKKVHTPKKVKPGYKKKMKQEMDKMIKKEKRKKWNK